MRYRRRLRFHIHVERGEEGIRVQGGDCVGGSTCVAENVWEDQQIEQRKRKGMNEEFGCHIDFMLYLASTF